MGMHFEAGIVFLSSDLEARNLCSHDQDLYRYRTLSGLGL